MFMPHRPERPPKSEGGKPFRIVSEYEPSGDQPQAIAELVAQAEAGARIEYHRGFLGIDVTPVISHRLPFDRYAEGFAAIEAGTACKVVLSLD